MNPKLKDMCLEALKTLSLEELSKEIAKSSQITYTKTYDGRWQCVIDTFYDQELVGMSTKHKMKNNTDEHLQEIAYEHAVEALLHRLKSRCRKEGLIDV